MPEDYSSIFMPERPPEPKRIPAKAPKPVPEPSYSYKESAAPSTYTQQPPAPPAVQPVIQNTPQPEPVVNAALPEPPAPIATEEIFGLFNNVEEKKEQESIEMLLSNPLRPAAQPEPVQQQQVQEDTLTAKLNNIMKQMQLREEEEKRQKEEQAKRIAAMQAQQAQYTTGFSMFPMVNPMNYMTSMVPMYQVNPYMTGYPGMGMQQPMGGRPYQVNILVI